LNSRIRFVCAIICLAAVFTLAGCGGDGGSGGSTVSPPTYPAPAVIYADSFPDDAAFNVHWSTEDATGGNASWAVIGGELSQTGHLEDNDLRDLTFAESSSAELTSYHLGTYAYLTDPSISGSYRFSVDILPKENNAGLKTEGNDVGILFGYVDDDNYYRVSMNARYGFTRFEKRSGGVFKTIAVNARGYVDENWVSMAAEISGGTIVVWIDGQPVFAWVDSNVLSGTVALYCQDRCRFDNVRITENPLQPTVAIAAPLAYSVTPDNSFLAQAVVLSQPDGSSVTFSLDGGGEIPATYQDGYYEVDFSGLNGEYDDITAFLRYADGTRADIDVNATVGAGGEYYVTVGDSITNGKYDFVPSDNDSADGRIVSIQGYQAPLADKLAPTRPVIVFNEGIAGDESEEMEARIVSILERHPGANGVLLLIGTNDSFEEHVSVGAFANNVDDTADLIVADGKQAWLAEILPTNDGDVDRNNWIQLYNLEIQAIANRANVFLGPDLYDAFNGHPEYYYDGLHPDYEGYGVIADQWYDKLH